MLLALDVAAVLAQRLEGEDNRRDVPGVHLLEQLAFGQIQQALPLTTHFVSHGRIAVDVVMQRLAGTAQVTRSKRQDAFVFPNRLYDLLCRVLLCQFTQSFYVSNCMDNSAYCLAIGTRPLLVDFQ